MSSAAHDDAHLKRDWMLFAGINFLFFFGFAVYNGVFMNFFREGVRGDELQLGIMESLREVPGLLTAMTAMTLVALAESRVAAIGLGITGVGIGLTGAMTGYWGLVGISVFWSIGFHLWSTMAPAITLHLAKGLEGGRHFGRMRSIGAVGNILALGLSWTVSELFPNIPYAVYFGVGGTAIVVASILAANLSHHASGGERQRLIVRREYGLYYLLIFLEGCRRQVFSIFALFTLIKVFNAPVQTILLLAFINAILTTFTAPRMGKFIDKVGEKKPLTIYAAGIILIFIGYATIPNPMWLFALYVVDNVLFTFSVALNTYLHKIVRPGELTPCLAMGVTMNHIAAVGLPVLGALVWKSTGNYQIPFMIGAGLAIAALIATQFMPIHPKPATDMTPEPAA